MPLRVFDMKKYIVISLLMYFLISISAFADPPAGYYDSAENLVEDELRFELHNIISTNSLTSYVNAKKEIFGYIDNDNETIKCVYTGFEVFHNYGDIENPAEFDCEHSFCQSWIDEKIVGTENSIAKADIHHLFPTKSSVNIARSNNSFDNVQNITHSYSEDGGLTTSFLGENSDGNSVFEPTDQHKGDVARALLYFDVRYETGLFFENVDMLETLIGWHLQDSVSEKEINRNDAIYDYQTNRNPFVDHPEFVELIWNEEQALTVSFPNETITLGLGLTYSITWFSHYFYNDVRIEIFDESSGDAIELVNSTENDGRWEWTISQDLIPDDDYKIRISDVENVDFYDESNENISIIETNPNSGLFISEYCKGTSYNKYIEIFNGTGACVDFSKYSLKMYHNGNSDPNYTIEFSNLLNKDMVFIISNPSANTTILNAADILYGGIQFNGDDAVGLYKNDELVDIIGIIGEDPGSGWNVAGIPNATKDHTLVRNELITGGNFDWNVSAGTNSENSEWIVYGCNTFDYLGSHFMNVELDTPQNVVVLLDNQNITISWEQVDRATSYKVYSSENPYSDFTEDMSGTFDGTTWTASISGSKKFFYITAVSE